MQPQRLREQPGMSRRCYWCIRPAATPEEATAPLPLRSCTGVADALGDRAGVHVSIIDTPAFLREATVAAAGEGRHAQ